MAVNASEARARFFPLIKQVTEDHAPVRISARSGDVVIMSADDFDSWQETLYLLRSPANARRLLDAVDRDRRPESATATPTRSRRAASGEDHVLTVDELTTLSRDA